MHANGHAAIKKLIEAHKATDEYKRNPEYANGMLAAWEISTTTSKPRSTK